MNYVPKIGMASGCGKSLEKGTVLFMLVRSGLSALSEGWCVLGKVCDWGRGENCSRCEGKVKDSGRTETAEINMMRWEEWDGPVLTDGRQWSGGGTSHGIKMPSPWSSFSHELCAWPWASHLNISWFQFTQLWNQGTESMLWTVSTLSPSTWDLGSSHPPPLVFCSLT